MSAPPSFVPLRCPSSPTSDGSPRSYPGDRALVGHRQTRVGARRRGPRRSHECAKPGAAVRYVGARRDLRLARRRTGGGQRAESGAGRRRAPVSIGRKSARYIRLLTNGACHGGICAEELNLGLVRCRKRLFGGGRAWRHSRCHGSRAQRGEDRLRGRVRLSLDCSGALADGDRHGFRSFLPHQAACDDDCHDADENHANHNIFDAHDLELPNRGGPPPIPEMRLAQACCNTSTWRGRWRMMRPSVNAV